MHIWVKELQLDDVAKMVIGRVQMYQNVKQLNR